MLTLSRTPDFTPLEEGVYDFTHTLYIHFRIPQSLIGLCLRINDTVLFAWISLTALCWTYFILIFSPTSKFSYLQNSPAAVRSFTPAKPVLLMAFWAVLLVAFHRESLLVPPSTIHCGVFQLLSHVFHGTSRRSDMPR